MNLRAAQAEKEVKKPLSSTDRMSHQLTPAHAPDRGNDDGFFDLLETRQLTLCSSHVHPVGDQEASSRRSEGP